MHREDIKAALRKKFKTLTAFEQVKSLPVGSVKDVLRGRAVSRTEKAISEAIGVPLAEIWPSRYSAPTDPSQSEAA
jgi:lambda repressor-like predicted transcriptional regulator